MKKTTNFSKCFKQNYKKKHVEQQISKKKQNMKNAQHKYSKRKHINYRKCF